MECNRFFFFFFQKSAKGEELFNDICDQLDIKSKDYVGLLFDNGSKVIKYFF